MDITKSAELLLHHFLTLPEDLQKEVIHFAEYLRTKAGNDPFVKNLQEIDLTEDQKEILNTRYKEFQTRTSNFLG